MLDKKLQLIDYEKIAVQEPNGKERRLVAFGKYAGLAGMIDTFSILGQRLLRKSWSTPFLNCPPTIYHGSLSDAKRAVQQMGEKIAAEGLPPGLEPLVFCMTGGPRGNVYGGVREIFDLLPHEMVAVEDLPEVHSSNKSDGHLPQLEYKVYGVTPEMKDIYHRSDSYEGTGSAFDRSHFMQHPELYRSRFAETIIPYTQVLINSIYWEHRFPRLLTRDDMFHLYEGGNER
jgi:alpha-aminoadipic semialdehyde synthase